MTAPPLFRVFDFRQKHQRLNGFKNAFREQPGDDRLAAADVNIDVAHTALGFFDHFPNHIGRPAHHRLNVDTEALLKMLFDRYS